MADSKGKTKSAILRELESIKGLLHDEDDIPILQEIIADAASSNAKHLLTANDLDDLHQAFNALNHAIGAATTNKTTASTAAALPHYGEESIKHPAGNPPQTFDKQHTASPTFPAAQTSLFADAIGTGETADEVSLGLDDFSSDENLTDLVTSPKAELASPITGSAVATTTKLSSPQQPRPSLAKASGENPFLPKHIRARLHGNNPPPLFDLSSASAPVIPASNSPIPKVNTDTSPNRQSLIREVIASMLPQVEAALRQRLQGMTEDQLVDLLNQED